jgi:MFS family permease
MATLICLAMFMCNFLAAGPTIAIVETAMDFFPNAGQEGLSDAISKTAYFFTTTALLQGVGNLFWMPLVNKYGRRPVYLASYSLYFGVALWLSFTTTYESFLAARILMGFASGAAETMAPLSIADGKSRPCNFEKTSSHISSVLFARTRCSDGVSILS